MDPLTVTVVVSRRPAPGRELELETWAQGFVELASRFPGHLTGEVLHSSESPGDVVVAISWANADAVYFWERSEERSAWLARADDLLLEPARPQSLSGFESIFAATASTSPVPRWKTALVIASAIYPASLVVNAVLGPVLAPWPLPLRLLATTAILVPFVSWVGVPWISRRVDGWLHRPASRP